MQKIILHSLAGLSFLLLPGVTHLSYAASYHAPLQQIMLLPQFCWGQYNDAFKGSQYVIPTSQCGWFINHYCPGLIQLQKSTDLSLSRNERRTALIHAEENTEYTLHGIANYPDCPIRAHVEKTYQDIKTRLEFMH